MRFPAIMNSLVYHPLPPLARPSIIITPHSHFHPTVAMLTLWLLLILSIIDGITPFIIIPSMRLRLMLCRPCYQMRQRTTRLMTPSSRLLLNQARLASTPAPGIISQWKMSSSANSYYQSAVSLASFSSDCNQTYPDWWPTDVVNKKHIALMDHIAHVIVPDMTSLACEKHSTFNCEDVIRWVVNTVNQNDDGEYIQNNSTETIIRQTKIEEWNEGQRVSNSSHELDSAYLHDPSTLQQVTNAKSKLSPIELLALGSVWYLSVSAAPPNMDRFDPSNGMKPRRLTVGDWNTTVQKGDYLRVHFDPRRFCETNRWNWGCNADNDEGKPGVIVARDDNAGYMIIDKPSNVPVHARVDNLLENVASSVGRMIWLEQKENLAFDSELSDVNTTEQDKQSKLAKKKSHSKIKQKMDQLIYVATPQRLDQNTTGLLVVATKKSFAAYFAKLLRTKVSYSMRF